jgi:aminopeptidase
MNTRATKLAEVLVNHSVKVKEGHKVIIDASDFTAIDLVHECYRLCLEKGAIPYLDIFGTNYQIGRADVGGLMNTFLKKASQQQLTTPPEIMNYKMEWADKFIRIVTIHNRNFLTNEDNDAITTWRKTYYPTFEKMINKDWVLTYFPTIGTAQNANMSLNEFTDFYYDACLVDYTALGQRIKALQDIVDAGSTVHITGKGIDLQLGIKGRLAAGADAGTHNVPDGECFTGPEEDVTEGYVEFEYPQVNDGNEVTGIRLEFKEGKIVNFSAETNQDFLAKVLNDHEGNRRLGELGIGMNNQITKYIKDILFDEKIAGTVHFAIGKAYESERGGGKNPGTIHWDMIKDLRHTGSQLKIDDQVVMQDGVLTI